MELVVPEPLWFEEDELEPLCAEDEEPGGWLATLGAPVDDPWALPPDDPCTLPPDEPWPLPPADDPWTLPPGGDPCTLPPGGVHPPSTDDW
ncbi:hypothetical protein ACFYO1_37455 [Nocardia sp. NPDC006044]|uniref:hypothetical protein n=1 Tax=Nocardia sp. NPDC006044 TaxID=3364306 RepID=UPI0036979D17